MAETNNTVKQPENLKVYDIPRNEVNMKLTEGRTTRGQDPGKVIFEPDVSSEARLLIWIGVSPEVAEALKPLVDKTTTAATNVIGILKSKLRTLTKGWADEAEDEDTGLLIDNKFIKFATDFSASGETKGELEEQYDELRTEFLKFNLNDSSPANQMAVISMMKKMQDLTIAIKQKERVRKVKPATETAAVPATA